MNLTDEQILEIRRRHPTALVLDGEVLNFVSDILAAAAPPAPEAGENCLTPDFSELPCVVEHCDRAARCFRFHNDMIATPPVQRDAEPVAILTISKFRGHLENRDFDYFGNLADGTYLLYVVPPRADPAEGWPDDLVTYSERTAYLRGRQDAAPLAQRDAQRDAEQAGLPPKYMLAKLQMVMPLFQEARDALTALTETQRVTRGISKTLADRMDEAGTFSLDDWIALSAAKEGQGK
jgi:hypothetical protein